MRLGGHFLPLSTIAWGLSIALLFGNVEALGRHTGLSNIPPLTIGAYSLADPRSIYYLILAAVGLACWFSHNLMRSRAGRAIRALRGGATLLASVGADAFRVRLTLFVMAALLAGLAGWLYAHMNRFVSPAPFDLQGSTVNDLIDFTPELRSEAKSILEHFVYGPIFTPPSVRDTQPGGKQGTIQMPGWVGGANWNGAAVDPRSPPSILEGLACGSLEC